MSSILLLSIELYILLTSLAVPVESLLPLLLCLLLPSKKSSKRERAFPQNTTSQAYLQPVPIKTTTAYNQVHQSDPPNLRYLPTHPLFETTSGARLCLSLLPFLACCSFHDFFGFPSLLVRIPFLPLYLHLVSNISISGETKRQDDTSPFSSSLCLHHAVSTITSAFF